MQKSLLLLAFSLIVMSLTLPAGAQTLPPAVPAGGGATFSAVGGLSASSSTNGVTLGGAFTFDFNDRLALEATGTWLDRGAGSDALHLNVGLLLNLLPAGNRAVPYVAVGGGLYRASFDLDHNRMFGGASTQFGPGTQMVPILGMPGFGMMQGFTGTTWQGPWTGPVFTPTQMPGFYQDRLGAMTLPQDGRWGMRSFTDPAITIGGGLNANLSEHLFVRPDARAIVVLGDGDRYTVGVLSFSIGYRF